MPLQKVRKVKNAGIQKNPRYNAQVLMYTMSSVVKTFYAGAMAFNSRRS
jgi:hypothetical protein